MEKIQKTINDPCLIDLRVGMNSSTINLESTTTSENISINCEYDRSVKLTILYEPDTTPESETLDNPGDKTYGGSDNCGYVDVQKFIDKYGNNIDIWQKEIENNKDETELENYFRLIILDYFKGSNEGDGLYVNDLGGNEDSVYPMIEGDNGWCMCELRGLNESFIYKTLSDNPFNYPRVAYFKHKTRNKRLKSGPKAGYKVFEEWTVTVVQKANPNAGDEQITYASLWGNDYFKNEFESIYNIDDTNDNYSKLYEEYCKSKHQLYSIGIISNANFNVKNIELNTQYKTDLSNALTYFKNNDVKFISNLGDLCINDNKDLIKFEEYYRLYAYNNGIRMFTCLGEYDYMKIYDKEENKNSYNQINKFNMNKIYKDIKYFEYDGTWDQINSGERNTKGKTNYYFIYKHPDADIEDIYVFLSVDYGINKFSSDNYLSRAVNKLDYNDKYVKELIPFAIEGGYNKEIDGNFDYQFYNSNTLLWLKDIIENNLDKHIFIFMHHGFPHKAGNGTSYNKIYEKSEEINGKKTDIFKNCSYYSQHKIFPYESHSSIMKSVDNSGSNSLCGLQFYFLNNLNNKYKNVTWFSGHSCYSWKEGESSFINQFSGDQYLNFCNKDFNIYKPTGNEYYQNPANSNTISKDYDERIYSRYPLIIKDDNKKNVRYEDDPIGTSAWNIHIPSLSCPLSRYIDKKETSYKGTKGSEGAILDIYPNGYRIRQILFKDDYTKDSNQNVFDYVTLNYINTVVGEKLILFG